MENVIVTIFKTESEAYQAFTELKFFKQSERTKIAQIALVKNAAGYIVEKDRFDFEDSTTNKALEGGLIGGLVGFLAGPLGLVLGYSAGSLYGLAAGDAVDTAEAGLIDVVAKKLLAGETAVIALVQENDEYVLDNYFAKYDTQILRWDIATVATEIEAAAKVEANLQNQAKAQLKVERKAAHKAKIEELKNSAKEKLAKLKF